MKIVPALSLALASACAAGTSASRDSTGAPSEKLSSELGSCSRTLVSRM